MPPTEHTTFKLTVPIPQDANEIDMAPILKDVFDDSALLHKCHKALDPARFDFTISKADLPDYIEAARRAERDAEHARGLIFEHLKTIPKEVVCRASFDTDLQRWGLPRSANARPFLWWVATVLKFEKMHRETIACRDFEIDQYITTMRRLKGTLKRERLISGMLLIMIAVAIAMVTWL